MPQLSYLQNAIIAQPGMAFDAEAAARDAVSRVAAVNIPFGVYCEIITSGSQAGQAQPLQVSVLGGATAVHVTNASAAVTWTGNVSIPAGQGVVFSSQPGVVYYFTAAISAAASGTLANVYSGSTSTTATMANAPYAPNVAGISLFDPLGVEQNYATWTVPTVLAGTVSVTNGSASITFSQNQTLAAGQPLVFSSQPGVQYFLTSAVTAGTAGTLTANYQGATNGSTTTTLPQSGSSVTGWKAGTPVPFMRRGRIWAAGDGGGTALRYGPINVNHSSTGANPQGVFTFSAVSQTAGSEIDVAPGVTIWNPDNITVPQVDPFGNLFKSYPVEINV